MSGVRPAQRRTPRRRRRGRRGGDRLPLPLMAAALVIAVWLCVTVVQWLLVHWWIPAAAVPLALAGGRWWWLQRTRRRQEEAARARRLRYQLSQLDALHHSQFEDAVRDLMYRDGCADAVRTGGRGDNGADVKATDPSGRRWVVQCKHRRRGLDGSPVGTPDLQVLNGTARPVHGADVVVLVTNGRFSKPAVPFGLSQRIHLVDRHLLAQWAAGSTPLWELLGRLPPPRKATPLS